MKWRTALSPSIASTMSRESVARLLTALASPAKSKAKVGTDAKSVVDIGEFQALVLSVVNALGENAYGMKIRDEVQTIVNRPVHMPQIYAALSRLEVIGSLASEANQGKSAGHRGRTRRYYRLTARGLQLLSDVVRLSHGAGPKEPDSNGERKKAATA
jgi:PadR family transcriptional regulator, regulatory protein PadR